VIVSQCLSRGLRRAIIFTAADHDRGEHQSGHQPDENGGRDGRWKREEPTAIACYDEMDCHGGAQAGDDPDGGTQAPAMKTMAVLRNHGGDCSSR
jgi:hypothetical protein